MSELAVYQWIVWGEPAPWQVQRKPLPNSRVRPGVVAMREFQDAIQWYFVAKYGQLETLITGLVDLHILFARSPTGKIPHEPTEAWWIKQLGKAPDLTNYLKAAEDALKGVVWRDDCLVVDENVHKRIMLPGCPGYTAIVVRELEGRPEPWPNSFPGDWGEQALRHGPGSARLLLPPLSEGRRGRVEGRRVAG